MQVIRATIKHLDVLAPLFDSYRQFYAQESDLTGARAFLAGRMARGESVILLAVDDEGLGLGFTQLYPLFSSVRLMRLWLLNDLFVRTGARRQGAARALMREAAAFARADGAKALMLETANDNHPARELYESLGWKQQQGFMTYQLMC